MDEYERIWRQNEETVKRGPGGVDPGSHTPPEVKCEICSEWVYDYEIQRLVVGGDEFDLCDDCRSRVREGEKGWGVCRTWGVAEEYDEETGMCVECLSDSESPDYE